MGSLRLAGLFLLGTFFTIPAHAMYGCGPGVNYWGSSFYFPPPPRYSVTTKEQALVGARVVFYKTPKSFRKSGAPFPVIGTVRRIYGDAPDYGYVLSLADGSEDVIYCSGISSDAEVRALRTLMGDPLGGQPADLEKAQSNSRSPLIGVEATVKYDKYHSNTEPPEKMEVTGTILRVTESKSSYSSHEVRIKTGLPEDILGERTVYITKKEYQRLREEYPF